MTRLQNIVFSEWAKWRDYRKLQGVRKPGIYLLGEFEKDPEGPADHLSESTILIALTYAKYKGIQGRLEEFRGCTISRETSPCCEGPTYAERCDALQKPPFGDLYVAILPVTINDNNERKTTLVDTKKFLLDEFQETHRHYPPMNRKRG